MEQKVTLLQLVFKLSELKKERFVWINIANHLARYVTTNSEPTVLTDPEVGKIEEEVVWGVLEVVNNKIDGLENSISSLENSEIKNGESKKVAVKSDRSKNTKLIHQDSSVNKQTRQVGQVRQSYNKTPGQPTRSNSKQAK